MDLAYELKNNDKYLNNIICIPFSGTGILKFLIFMNY
jgi:hypothetical protein